MYRLNKLYKAYAFHRKPWADGSSRRAGLSSHGTEGGILPLVEVPRTERFKNELLVLDYYWADGSSRRAGLSSHGTGWDVLRSPTHCNPFHGPMVQPGWATAWGNRTLRWLRRGCGFKSRSVHIFSAFPQRCGLLADAKQIPTPRHAFL